MAVCLGSNSVFICCSKVSCGGGSDSLGLCSRRRCVRLYGFHLVPSLSAALFLLPILAGPCTSAGILAPRPSRISSVFSSSPTGESPSALSAALCSPILTSSRDSLRATRSPTPPCGCTGPNSDSRMPISEPSCSLTICSLATGDSRSNWSTIASSASRRTSSRPILLLLPVFDPALDPILDSNPSSGPLLSIESTREITMSDAEVRPDMFLG